MKINIKQIRSDKYDKSGRQYLDRNEDPYTKVSIYDGDRWYTAFDRDGWTSSFSEGDTIDVKVVEREYQGKTYYNIERIKESPTAGANPSEALEILKRIEKKVSWLYEHHQPDLSPSIGEGDRIEPDDLPF